MIKEINIVDLSVAVCQNIAEMVTSLDLSWTLDAVSQLKFEVHDPGFEMMKNNYFMVRRGILYANEVFEIASVETSQGPGAAPKHTVEARRAAVQGMKRDKSPEAYSGATATDYARIVANKFLLKFVGQPTAVKGAIIKANTPEDAESTWDVLNRLASEAKFVVFESNQVLYFASQEWLVGKWANITLRYPSPENDPYTILEIPTCRRSDDDITTAEIQLILDRTNAVNLRPGMTINLKGMYEFDLSYLITEVAYGDGDNMPVAVAARTPEKPDA
jgi:hypothetical protein